ncbi:K02A2.6-like [Cordylochernes scorpioides]|uniref:K02A2.6-like n=1 Tax=Cordylochernes scorpioides TaxID=51811 RepID=A0ABY6L2Z7_9ARAC|nr:K02A2.6-like [Cordylochernes scorpioides]
MDPEQQLYTPKIVDIATAVIEMEQQSLISGPKSGHLRKNDFPEWLQGFPTKGNSQPTTPNHIIDCIDSSIDELYSSPADTIKNLKLYRLKIWSSCEGVGLNPTSDTSVWIRDQGVEGKVLHKSQEPRSYWVQTPQGKVRRNRLHLTRLPTTESTMDAPEDSRRQELRNEEAPPSLVFITIRVHGWAIFPIMAICIATPGASTTIQQCWQVSLEWNVEVTNPLQGLLCAPVDIPKCSLEESSRTVP